MSEHKEILRRLQEIVEEGYVMMYLIKKTGSKKPEKMRTLLTADLENVAKEFFQETLDGCIDKMINSDDIEFKEFSTGSELPEDVLIIDGIESIPTLPNILYSIDHHTNLDNVVRFDTKSVKNLYAFALEISRNEDDKVIYFRKHTPRRVLSASRFTFIIKNGVFDKLKEDVFKFDDMVDCIYYELDGKKQMYVINTINFEDIFAYTQRYKELSDLAYDTLNSSGHIDIDEELFDEIKDERSYYKKLAILHQNGIFSNLDIQYIKRVYEKAQGRLNFILENGKVVVNTKEGLKDFLDVCEEHILQSVADEDVLYRVPSAKEI